MIELRAIVRKTTSKVSVNVAAFLNSCHHIGATGQEQERAEDGRILISAVDFRRRSGILLP